MAVTVRFIADVVNWLSGLDKSEAAVDDNADALEDLMRQAVELGTQAGKTADEIADDFSKAFGVPLDRAKRAVDEVIDSTDQLGDAAKQASDDAAAAGDDIASGLSDGAADAGDSITELGSIARDVLAGDFASATESAIGSLGGLAAAAGVGGAVGGAIITALAAVAGAVVAEWQRAAEETEQRISDMYDDMTESGNKYLSATYLISAANALIADDEQIRKAQAYADILGLELPTVIGALVGSTEDLATAQAAVNDQIAGLGDEAGIAQSILYDFRDEIDGIGDSVETAGGKASTLDAFQTHLLEAEAAAGRATTAVDEFGNMVYTLPDGKTVTIDAATGKATTDVNTFVSGVPKNIWTTITVDDSNVRNWRPPLLAPITQRINPYFLVPTRQDIP